MKRLGVALALSGLLLAASAVVAGAQTTPQGRPVTIVVPYPAGGVSDVLARLIGEHMQGTLGQPVVVENVAGGSGAIAVGRVARAAPDGLSIVFGNVETNVTNVVSQPLTYDTFNDLEPVAMMPSYPFIIVSKNAIPAKSLPELVAWLRGNQDKVFQATVGAGSVQHLCGLLMQERLGLKWSFVPYRGGAQALQDMIGGQIDIMCTSIGSFLPQVRAGAIRGYAITAAARMEGAPEVPTVDEAGGGLGGLHASVWNAMWTTKGAPAGAVARLNDAATKALADPALRKRIIDMGLDLPPADRMSTKALDAYQRAEAERWWPVMKKAMAAEAAK